MTFTTIFHIDIEETLRWYRHQRAQANRALLSLETNRGIYSPEAFKEAVKDLDILEHLCSVPAKMLVEAGVCPDCEGQLNGEISDHRCSGYTS